MWCGLDLASNCSMMLKFVVYKNPGVLMRSGSDESREYKFLYVRNKSSRHAW